MNTEPNKFRQRVIAAAEAALAAQGSVGPLELFQSMGVLYPGHVAAWRKGHEAYPVLEACIQLGEHKYSAALGYFAEWIQARGLRPIAADYLRNSPRGTAPLQITFDGNPEREKFYRTHYAPADLSPKQENKLKEKTSQAPELVVFIKVTDDGKCSECGKELGRGSFLYQEKGQPLCLGCADLDRLEFLPSGDRALSLRARKYSELSAVVMKFSRSRKRYERQGLLVTSAALARAEAECLKDAPQ